MGLIDKFKSRAAYHERQQRRAEEERRKEKAAAQRAMQLRIERAAAFAELRTACPLPLQFEKVAVAGGLELLNDEFVVSIARDWGWSTHQLTLTTHRLLWSHNQKSVNLSDIRDIVYRKPFLGFGSIMLETAGGQNIERLPAGSNGEVIGNQLMSLIQWARQRAQQKPATTPAQARLEQLRQLAELKAQGVLSEEEFQVEKAKILAQRG